MFKSTFLILLLIVIACSETAFGADLIIYPAKGQSAQQLDRDRYECHRWAVEQTGFGPSNPSAAAPATSDVAPPREPVLGRGSQPNAVRGGARGAALGAAGGAIAGDAGKGAAVGATFGALRGAMRRRDRQSNESSANTTAGSSSTASTAYNRAMSAVLRGAAIQ